MVSLITSGKNFVIIKDMRPKLKFNKKNQVFIAYLIRITWNLLENVVFC